MTMKDPRAVAEAFTTAFSHADWHGFRAPLADNVSYQETGTQRRTQDADAYVKLCQE